MKMPVNRREVSRTVIAAARVTMQSIPGLFGVALVTAGCFAGHFDLGIPGFLYLIIVVVQSLNFSYASSAVVSVTAAACLEYFFIPPVLEWQIDDPEDALALCTYLVTSLVITRLASKVRRETLVAESKRRDLALLYSAATRLLTLKPEYAAGPQALRIFREVFNLNAVCLFDAAGASVEVDGTPQYGLIAQTRDAYARGGDYRSADGWLHIRALCVQGKTVGAVGFEGRFDDEAALLPVFALLATTIERARSFRSASEAMAAAQTEMLRSAILDAFAHELKTPQAVIMTAAGSLRATGGLRSEQLEMTGIIEAAIGRLNRLTSQLLRMARLDRDEVKPNMQVTSLPELVTHLVSQYYGESSDYPVSIRLTPDTPEVMIDPELISLALAQLLDNARKYSVPGSSVTVEIAGDREFAVVSVINDGKGIRVEEREKIFERFYRGQETANSAPGSGLGLYVARKIVRAHAGELELHQDHSARGTVTFRMRLPIIQQELKNEYKSG